MKTPAEMKKILKRLKILLSSQECRDRSEAFAAEQAKKAYQRGRYP
ncbi:MAG: hypothetical protein LUQ50_15635 [Methanospirillum sp.]|nr:hypothetical protein [Methanospirillum sp.]MDD1730486.1 hypothetical protein [Methanospirillum sp.]